MILLLFVLNFLVTAEEQSGETVIEIPEIVEITPDVDSVSILFSCINPPCFQQPLSIFTDLSCSTSWCKNRKDHFNLTSEELIINDILPFTNYKMQFQFCLSRTNCPNVIYTKEFVTKPAAPKQIKEITVYSKNETSVSLKVKPPYPPTGKLEVYRASYRSHFTKNGDMKEQLEEFPVKSCDLWPDYHCFTIHNLTNNETYHIYLQSRNKNCSFFSQNSHVVSAKTKLEPSEAPFGLNIKWTSKDKYLNLSWKHPYKTNEKIKYFDIVLIRKDAQKHFIMDIDKYSPQYSYKIDAKELLNFNEYEIRISAYNGYNGKEAVGKVEENITNGALFSLKTAIILSLLTCLLWTAIVICLRIWMAKNRSSNTDNTNSIDSLCQIQYVPRVEPPLPYFKIM